MKKLIYKMFKNVKLTDVSKQRLKKGIYIDLKIYEFSTVEDIMSIVIKNDVMYSTFKPKFENNNKTIQFKYIKSENEDFNDEKVLNKAVNCLINKTLKYLKENDDVYKEEMKEWYYHFYKVKQRKNYN